MFSGSFSRISASRAFIRSAISRLFSPASIIVVPMTVSAPSIVAAPVNDVLPFVSAAFIDVRNARNDSQQRFDCIFLKFVQLGQLLLDRFGFWRAGLVGNVVVKNFAQTCADRRE